MGFAELLAILFLVLLFFGAAKLPALGEGLGKAVRGFKNAVRSEPPPARPAPKKELPPPVER
jgi:TatA/E family protein of Tat protein translocase